MRSVFLLSVVGLCLMAGMVTAEVYTIDTKAQWERWTYPKGLVEVTEEGSLRIIPLSRTVNAVADAGQFKQDGDIVRAGSNQTKADRVMDGDVRTWWKPRENDGLDQWWIDVDLGRAVVANKIRLTFPDTVGAKPFRYFSVWTSPGVHVQAAPGKFRYTRAGATIGANRETVVEYDLSTYNPSPATGAYLNTADRLPFEPVQYVRFQADGKNKDAALAEIEVETIGYNIAIKAPQWGGDIKSAARTRGAEYLIDGSIDTGWGMEWSPEQTWRAAGTWWKLDLGSLFYIDRIVFIPNVQGVSPYFYGWDSRRAASWQGIVFKTSDGTPSGAIGGGERAEGDFKYELLSEIDNNMIPRRWLFDLSFPTRRVRYIFWHWPDWANFHQWTQAIEIFVYGVEGFPGQVELTSEWMDFDEARSFSAVEWDADLPPGTRIEVRTRSGNTLDVMYHYFTNTGVEVTREKYKKLPSVAQGEVTHETRIGSDWSGWSEAHRFSGQMFLSPTPRRYVQAKVFLYSDDPQVAPSLRSLSFVYNPPLIKQGVLGRIFPREAALDSLEMFQYTLWPKYSAGDPGFDQVLIRVPSAAEEVSAQIGGQEVTATSHVSGDSLLVQLPRRVTRDSVEVVFKTRVFDNPTVFEVLVMDSRRPERWQAVAPLEANAEKVYVPSIYGERELIRNVLVDPRVITPNGDGIGEALQVSFHVVKALRAPTVEIYTLNGERLRTLGGGGLGVRYTYGWDGRDESGALVLPGVYLLQICIDADVGSKIVSTPIYVAY